MIFFYLDFYSQGLAVYLDNKAKGNVLLFASMEIFQ